MSTLTTARSIDPFPTSGHHQLGETDISTVGRKPQGNHSDFVRWRPSFHLLAPHGWLNDPCGPGYDSSRGRYLLAFQWNPNGNDWDNISWGLSTSTDLVSWETFSQPCLVPAAPYDRLGIFTGCLRSTNVDGKQDGTLTYLYTSVNQLPIHYTIPYTPGCETLSIAVSHNGGDTWERLPFNPILPGPPESLKVTGWRDPFISSWGSAPAQVRREGVLYGFISGGLSDVTPTVFVYTINEHNLAEWKFAGPLIDVGLNLRPSRWTGDFGVNWEVANLVSLTDNEGSSRDFVIMGSEGCLPRDEKERAENPIARDSRIHRSQLWMCVKERTPADGSASAALMEYSFGGIFDNGLLYAANSFWDPVIEQQVVFGWITEEDLPDNLRHRQGWSGLISLPRVLSLMTIHRVKRARSTADIRDITSIEATPDDSGTHTIRTMKISPDPRLRRLRMNSRKTDFAHSRLYPVGSGTTKTTESTFLPLYTSRWEVDARFDVGHECSRVGIVIYHDAALQDKTLLVWDQNSETFMIERPNIWRKQSDTPVNHAPEVSPHTLFTYISHTKSGDGCGVDEEREEPLHIHAFYDSSVLEVFINERTVLSTRIYYPADTNGAFDIGCHGIYFFAEGSNFTDAREPSSIANESSTTALLGATVWDGLGA
ncbi:CAZyme family GH32 [Paecilomyces variotii]|nr:CAZyme family GH32 [Paecilomyces variotii]